LKINVNQLSTHLQKSLAPCYLVTGDEHLLVDEALDAIRAAAREQGFTSRELHVATTGFDWAQLHASGANLSLFAEKRIIELRVPTGKPGPESRAGQAARRLPTLSTLPTQTFYSLLLHPSLIATVSPPSGSRRSNPKACPFLSGRLVFANYPVGSPNACERQGCNRTGTL